MDLKYDKARLSLKVLITFFLMFVGLSYCLALINIQNNVGMSFTGVVVHYRGGMEAMSDPPELAFAKFILCRRCGTFRGSRELCGIYAFCISK